MNKKLSPPPTKPSSSAAEHQGDNICHPAGRGCEVQRKAPQALLSPCSQKGELPELQEEPRHRDFHMWGNTIAFQHRDTAMLCSPCIRLRKETKPLHFSSSIRAVISRPSHICLRGYWSHLVGKLPPRLTQWGPSCHLESRVY